MGQGLNFLKKLWAPVVCGNECFVSVINRVDTVLWPPRRDSNADVWSVSLSLEGIPSE